MFKKPQESPKTPGRNKFHRVGNTSSPVASGTVLLDISHKKQSYIEHYFLLLSVFLLVFQTLIYSCKVCEFWIIKVQQQTPKKMLHFFLHFRQRLNLQFYVVFKMFICCGLLHSIKSTVYLYKNIFLCLVFTSLIQISSFSLPTL